MGYWELSGILGNEIKGQYLVGYLWGGGGYGNIFYELLCVTL